MLSFLEVTGVFSLADMLPQCTSLISLDVSDNEIGPDGIERLAAVNLQCTTLTELRL